MIVNCECGKLLRKKEPEEHHKDFPDHKIKGVTCCGRPFKNVKQLEQHFEMAHLFFKPID